jgi:hypothetical protein
LRDIDWAVFHEHFVSHGVDVESFAAAAAAQVSTPEYSGTDKFRIATRHEKLAIVE